MGKTVIFQGSAQETKKLLMSLPFIHQVEVQLPVPLNPKPRDHVDQTSASSQATEISAVKEGREGGDDGEKEAAAAGGGGGGGGGGDGDQEGARKKARMADAGPAGFPPIAAHVNGGGGGGGGGGSYLHVKGVKLVQMLQPQFRESVQKGNRTLRSLFTRDLRRMDPQWVIT